MYRLQVLSNYAPYATNLTQIAEIDLSISGSLPTYTLTMNNGTGGGDYITDARVNIQANPVPAGKVFDRWRIDSGSSAIDDEYNPSTTLTMGSAYTTITAAYKESGDPGKPVITASGENSPNETQKEAFDGSISTKWLTFADSGWIQYDFAGNTAKAVNGYSLTSANDYPERDPRDWRLLGSNDGSYWTILDTRYYEDFPGRYVTNNYTFSNITPYKMYRLDIHSNFNPQTANSTQIAEITFKTLGSQP